MTKKRRKVANRNNSRKILITFALVVAILILLFIAFYAISLFSEKYYRDDLKGELASMRIISTGTDDEREITFGTDIELTGVYPPGKVHEDLLILRDYFFDLALCDDTGIDFAYEVVSGPSERDDFIIILDEEGNLDFDLTTAETGEYTLKVLVQCISPEPAPGAPMEISTAAQISSNVFSMSVFYCRDSDGGQADVENRGTADNKSDKKTDFCNDQGELTEYYCNRNDILNIPPGSCSSGFKCSEGACVEDRGDPPDPGNGDPPDPGNGDPPITCTDSCSSLGLECGTHNICGATRDCGTCSEGSCVGGSCVTGTSEPPKINTISPNDNEVPAEPNETIKFTISGENYDKIEWLQDGVVVSTNNDFYDFSEDEEGEYEVKVRVSKGGEEDERSWKVNVQEREKPSPFSWGLLILILAIVGIGILLVILFLVKNMLHEGSAPAKVGVAKKVIPKTVKTPVKPLTKPAAKAAVKTDLGNLASKGLKPK